MRFLLDAHVSGRGIGEPLRERGHDVRALDQEQALEGLDDEALLEFARAERRILVTFDKDDFPRILREWGAAGRSHAGVILVYGLRHHELGQILRGIDRKLERYRTQDDWIDVPAVVSPDRC